MTWIQQATKKEASRALLESAPSAPAAICCLAQQGIGVAAAAAHHPRPCSSKNSVPRPQSGQAGVALKPGKAMKVLKVSLFQGFQAFIRIYQPLA